MSLKLYYAPGACSFVPHAALELAGADFEPVLVKLHKGEHQTPEFRALNPRGQVPVLVDGDTPVTQIVAICLHLDARFPQAGLLPAQGMARTRALETLMWMNNTVHPTFTHVFMPQKFTDDEAAQKAIRAFALRAYRNLLGEIEALAVRATPWLAGAQPSALDAYALTLLRWGGFAGIDPDSLPNYKADVDRVAAHPAVASAIAREGIKLSTFRKA